MKKNFNISAYHFGSLLTRRKKRRSKRKRSNLEMLNSALFINLKKWFKKKGIDIVISILCLMIYGCDEHQDFPDTSIKVGQVLCSDGSIVNINEALTREDLLAVGVVFYTNNSLLAQGNGYAVALNDLPLSYSLTDSLGLAQGTSADIEAFDGNSNTYALYESSAGSPAATALFSYWTYGQSAFIPSVAEIRLLFNAKDIINPILETLKGDPLLDEPQATWYWTSTEVDTQEKEKAWLFSMASGAIQETPKDESHKIRPIITLWY